VEVSDNGDGLGAESEVSNDGGGSYAESENSDEKLSKQVNIFCDDSTYHVYRTIEQRLEITNLHILQATAQGYHY